MRIQAICRSCGETQKADLSAGGGKVVCDFCEHESSVGDDMLRQKIETQQAKTRLLISSAGATALLSAILVGARITLVESKMPDSGVGLVLWIVAGLLFAASAACLVLGESSREVVYF